MSVPAAAAAAAGVDGVPAAAAAPALVCSYSKSVNPPPSKEDPFPHLRIPHTDAVLELAALDARDLAAGGAAPKIEEPTYSAEEMAQIEQLRSAVAAMVADSKQMVATADDYPGGMHQHWTTYWPEGRNHPLFADHVSQLDRDPARWSVHELHRFLKARDFNLKKSTKMFFHYIRWRVVFGASHIATFPSGPWEPLISSILSASYHKWDKQGRPLYIQKSGAIDVDRFAREVSLSKIGVGHTWFTEQMKLRMGIGSRKTGKLVTKLVMILDIKGLGLSARKMMKIFQITSYIDQHFSPECMGCMYIVNAPSFFPVIFSLAKAFLSAETQKKIKIFGSGAKAQEEVVRDLGAECLPEEYGGTCRCPGGCCPVPSGVPPYGYEPGHHSDEEGEEETIHLAAGYAKEVELHLLGNGAHEAVAAAVAAEETGPAAAAVAGAAAASAASPAVVSVAAGEEAFWSVTVAARDVDFSVEFRPTGCNAGSRRASRSSGGHSRSASVSSSIAAAAAAAESSAAAADGNGVTAAAAAARRPVTVLPVTRLSSSSNGEAVHMGVYAAECAGTLVFRFSNEYSRWNSKTVTLRSGTRAKRN